MSKKITWYGILGIGSLSLIFLTIGFVEALRFTLGGAEASPVRMGQEAVTVSAEKKVKNSREFQVLIMGDSIARGTGDETNKGIGENLKELFKDQTSKDIVVENAGIEGSKSKDLLEILQSGRAKAQVQAADLIVISIGGNDLRGVQNVSELERETSFNQRKEAYIKDLKEILRLLRLQNKEATLTFVGLYNPYGEENTQENGRLVNEWNYATQGVIEEDGKGIFIATYDLFKFNLERLISKDKLHPNAAGYRLIAGQITKAMESLTE